MKRRQFRFSLDPMDPVEGEALRQIDEIADQAKEMFGENISQDEADRYAFKRILLGLLKDRPVELTAPARSAPVAIAPATLSAPAAVPPTPAAPQPEAARTPVEQPPKVQEVVEAVGKEGDQEEGTVDGSQTSSATTETSASSPEPSWHEQLLSSEAAKPASPLNNLVWAGNRPSE